MASILRVLSPQPYRITVEIDSTPSTTPGDYTVTRAGGAGVSIACTFAWAAGGRPGTVELALSAPLLASVDYVLAVAGAGSAPVSYRQPIEPVATGTAAAVDASFGVDRRWIAGSLGPGRDLRSVSGLECLRYDLVAAALTRPGELFHLPSDGAGLADNVNGPGGAGSTSLLGASVRRQWTRDRRVAPGGVSAPTIAEGDVVSVSAAVKTRALDGALTVTASATRG